MNTDTPTTTDPPTLADDLSVRVARDLRDTAFRCVRAADQLDPPASRLAFPFIDAEELAATGVRMAPRSMQWAVTVEGHEVLLTWTSYEINGCRWQAFLDGAEDEARSFWGHTAAEAVEQVPAGIAERRAS